MKFLSLIAIMLVAFASYVELACPSQSTSIGVILKVIIYGPQELIEAIYKQPSDRTDEDKALMAAEIESIRQQVCLT